MNMRKRNFTRLFDSRQSHLDSRIRRDYIANGIATIHCQISKYNDIISAYSVKDKESLNDFAQKIMSEISKLKNLGEQEIILH